MNIHTHRANRKAAETAALPTRGTFPRTAERLDTPPRFPAKLFFIHPTYICTGRLCSRLHVFRKQVIHRLGK